LLRKEDQDLIKSQLNALEQKGFPKSRKARSRDDAFWHFQILEKEEEKMEIFFKGHEIETITGFTTVKRGHGRTTVNIKLHQDSITVV